MTLFASSLAGSTPHSSAPSGLVRFHAARVAAAGGAAAREKLGGECTEDDAHWFDLREHRLPFFRNGTGNLWRWSCAPTTPLVEFGGDQLLDWGGAQRWFFSERPGPDLRAEIEVAGGHLECFRSADGQRVEDGRAHLPAALRELNVAVNRAFDPHGLFNPGRF